MTILTHIIALLIGGAGGYVYGAKAKATAATVAADLKATVDDVKKL